MSDLPGSYLSVQNLSVFYGVFQAVREVSLTVPMQRIISLIGANGSGKSTIMKTISGLKEIAGGKILFQGARIDGRAPHEIVKMGVVQVPEGRGLFSDMTVLENLQLGAQSRYRLSNQEWMQAFKEVCELFPVLWEKTKIQAGSLSGGEMQMLAIARCLLAKPNLILLDEPLQGLAPLVIKQIADVIIDLKQKGHTILMVEHNITMAFETSDFVYILDSGEIVLAGKPQELSETDYVKEFYLGV
jgi:branched-chain amino acid transport system ATP-binding protein